MLDTSDFCMAAIASAMAAVMMVSVGVEYAIDGGIFGAAVSFLTSFVWMWVAIRFLSAIFRLRNKEN